METWVVGCLVFVFLALIEYGIVLRIISGSKEKAEDVQDEVKAQNAKKKHKTLIAALQVWQKQKQQNVRPDNLNLDQTLGDLQPEELVEEVEKEAKQQTHRADKIAIVVLPILFFIFNLIYWIHYTAA